MMTDVIHLRPRAHARQREEEFTHVVGMLVALGSWGMMFACAFFVYFGLRSQEPVWPPLGVPDLPVGLPAANTIVIVASSLALAHALKQLRAGKQDAVRWMGVTLALGCSFVALQGLLWRNMWLDGVTVHTGSVGTIFYGLTALHTIHVAAGILVLTYLLVKSIRLRAASSTDAMPVVHLRLCGMFWHFVGAVWLFMFVALFLY
jgi:cytochrome c oxidase subunit III